MQSAADGNVVFRFDWDDGNWPKCGKHGVAKSEIEALFGREPQVLPDRTIGVEIRYNAVGTTEGGRFVFVVFTLRDDRIRPISARTMHEKERASYERQKET